VGRNDAAARKGNKRPAIVEAGEARQRDAPAFMVLTKAAAAIASS
jgi:hypothetical protein